MKYLVRFYMDNTYEVIDATVRAGEYPESYFQGRLADCEAWIRLKEGGRLC